MLEQTITGNNKVRLDIEYPIVAGVDKDSVPQLLQVDDEKNLKTVTIAGFALPPYDKLLLDYYGSTNNIKHAVYYKQGVIVATLTLTYVGGAAADNDRPASVIRT
jgi:hypothetical protein